MLTTADMLELYRAEREAMEWPSEPFTPFGEWKEEFMVEYRRNHVSVDAKVAIAESDKIVDEALAELLLNEEEETTMSKTSTVNQASVDAKREARNARRRELRAAKRAEAHPAAKPAKKAAKATTVTTAVKTNKTSAARVIFDEMYGKSERKEVIARFKSEAGLTANGASTYYQKFKATV